jgi:hypothetical protein
VMGGVTGTMGTTTPYTVTLGQNEVVNNLIVQGDYVTLATSGNTLSVGGSLTIDSSSTGLSGSLTVGGGGALSVSGNEAIGEAGTGVFTQTDGTHSVGGNLTVGDMAGAVGTFTLSSGTLNVTGNEIVGNSGAGTFTQTGGTHTIGGNLTIAANTGSSGVFNLQGGTLSAQSITVNAGGTLNIQTVQDARTPIATSVTNTGTIFLSADGVHPAAAVTINGDYTQAPQGTLKVQANANSWAALNVTGTANLAGTLDVEWTGSQAPTIGQSLPIMNYGSVSGRFSKMLGAVIQGADDKPIAADSNEFFGLLYGTQSLNLITLQVPQLATGGSLASSGAQGLVLVAHGANVSAAGWPTQMAQDIEDANFASGVAGKWDVATIDWSPYDGPYSANPATSATIASQNANDIGESLAFWMQEKGLNYQQMHLIGHSAGVWLTNGLTDGLKDQGSSTQVQDTFLDAYNPPSIALQGYNASNYPALGKNATYAEQYFDGVNDGNNPGLATILPYAVNYNVASLANNYLYQIDDVVGPHAWPRVWYDDTVQGPTGTLSAGGYGFAKSVEYNNGVMPSYGTTLGTQQGDATDLPSGFPYNSCQYQPPFDPLSLDNVTSGSVLSDGQGDDIFSAPAGLTSDLLAKTTRVAADDASSPTGTPAILTAKVNLTSVTNMMQISGQFLSSGHGLLSIYFDGSEVAEVEELDAGSDPFVATDIYLGNTIQPGINTIMFRLDSYDNLDSTVELSDMEFGFASESVPEPAASWSGGVFLIAAGALRRPRRTVA